MPVATKGAPGTPSSLCRGPELTSLTRPGEEVAVLDLSLPAKLAWVLTS